MKKKILNLTLLLGMISSPLCAEFLKPNDDNLEEIETRKSYYDDGIYDAIFLLKKEINNSDPYKKEIKNIAGKYIVIKELKGLNFVKIINIKNTASKLNLFDIKTVMDQEGNGYLLFSIQSREDDAIFILNKLKEVGIVARYEKASEYLKLKHYPVVAKEMIWEMRELIKDMPTKVIVVEKDNYIPVVEKQYIKEEKKEIPIVKVYEPKLDEKTETYKKMFGTEKVSDLREEKQYIKEEKIIKIEEAPKIEKTKIDINEQIKIAKNQLSRKAIKVKQELAFIYKNKVYKKGDAFNEYLTIEDIFEKEKSEWIISYLTFKEDRKKEEIAFASIKKKYLKNDYDVEEKKEKVIKSIQEEKKEKIKLEVQETVAQEKEKIKLEVQETVVQEKEKIVQKEAEQNLQKININEEKRDPLLGNSFSCDFKIIRKAYLFKGNRLIALKIDQENPYYGRKLDFKIRSKIDDKYELRNNENLPIIYLDEKYLNNERYCNAIKN